MGCCLSKGRKFYPSDSIEGQGPEVFEMLHSLGLADDAIDLLYNAFLEIDADRSNWMSALELYSYFKIDIGLFERHIFTLFDQDKSGLLSFIDFAVALWNFLTLQECDLGTLMYTMRDPTAKLRIRCK